MLRYIRPGMLIFSIAYLLIGLLLLVAPEQSLLGICYASGVIVLATGIANLAGYLRRRGKGSIGPFLLISGVVTTVLGVVILRHPTYVVSFLPVVFGIFIAADGALRVMTGFDLAKRRGEKWQVMLLFGILSVLLGLYLVFRPFAVAVTVAMLCGILLVVEGAVNLACVLLAASEFYAMERMAASARNAEWAAAGDVLDEQEAQDAEFTEIEERETKTDE